MADRSRVPVTLPGFNKFISNTGRYLQAIDPITSLPNWQRLELKPAEATWWNDQYVYWRDTLFKKVANKGFRTKADNADITAFRANFKKDSARILDKIAAADAATNLDEAEFNLKLKKHRKKPTYHTVHIQDVVALGLEIIGGGRMRIKCRTAHDSKRGSIPPMANSVQLAYSIGEAPVGGADALSLRVISTRSSFDLELGYSNIGKYVYIYARWYHTKHPHLAGGWSNMVRSMIA